MTRIEFILLSMFRRKLRVSLTIFSLITAFLLFVLLRSVAVVFETDEQFRADNRLQTQAKYSMIDLLPLSYQFRIASLDGVQEVTHASWFGGVYQDGDTFMATFPVDHTTYFTVHPDYTVSPEHLKAFQETRTGALVPVSMLQQFDWEVGQKVPLRSPIYPLKDGSNVWTFDIVGTYTVETQANTMSAFLFRYDYVEEASSMGGSFVGWFVTRVEDPNRAPEIANAIDQLFVNSSDPTRSAPESAAAAEFLKQYGDISLMMSGILGAVFFTMILLTGNTMAQGYRERIPELAVLKTLGFSDLSVGLFIVVEAVFLCLLSATLGIAFGVLAVELLGSILSQIIPTSLSMQTIYFGAIVALVLGLGVSVIPAISANRLEIVDALHLR